MFVEVTHCNQINCKWLKEERVVPPDSFEMPYEAATCTHPGVPGKYAGLGCNDEQPFDHYCKIPEWCPLARKQKEVIRDEKPLEWRPVYQGDEIINYRCPKCETGDTFGKSPIEMNYCPKCGQRLTYKMNSDTFRTLLDNAIKGYDNVDDYKRLLTSLKDSVIIKE